MPPNTVAPSNITVTSTTLAQEIFNTKLNSEIRRGKYLPCAICKTRAEAGSFLLIRNSTKPITANDVAIKINGTRQLK